MTEGRLFVPAASDADALVDRDDPAQDLLQFRQPLEIRFAVPQITLLELSSELLLDRLGSRPSPKLLLIALIAGFQVGQCTERALKLWQKIGWIPRFLPRSGCRPLHNRGTRHEHPPSSGEGRA